MNGSRSEPIKVTPSPRDDRTPLEWHSVGHHQGEATSDECGKSRFRGHFDQMSGRWHVRGFRKSCGRVACPTCRDRVALKEAVKAEKRLRRGLSILHHDGGPAPRRWGFILDPGATFTDWWTRLDTYQEQRARANAAVRAAGLRSWAMVLHAEDDDPERGCPWRGHFHVIGDGELGRDMLRSTGWTTRLDALPDTSPVGWLTLVLSRLSSFTYRRSIQRLTYGGLAAPNAQARAGGGGAGSESQELRCTVCDREIPRGEWLRAIPTRGLGPEGEGCWAVDEAAWRFEPPLEPWWGHRRRIPVAA